MGQQDRKGHEMQSGQRLRQALVVTRQPAEACHPTKAAFYHPTSWQQDKPMLGRWQFDHLQANALGLRVGGGLLPV